MLWELYTGNDAIKRFWTKTWGKKLLPLSSALQNFPVALLAQDELHA
jgi:hypothetical protein